MDTSNLPEDKPKIPTMEELFAKYPPKTLEEIGNFEFEDEDEEEAFDMRSSMLPFERKFYNDEGEWIGDDDEAVDAREKQLEERGY